MLALFMVYVFYVNNTLMMVYLYLNCGCVIAVVKKNITSTDYIHIILYESTIYSFSQLIN